MTTLNYSQLLATYGKPRRVTTLTTGSGTHTLLTDGSLCTITLVGGGGGGASGSSEGGTQDAGAGGGAGQTVIRTVRLYGAQAYSVGSGGGGGAGVTAAGTGNVGADGGTTTLGVHAAAGGEGGNLPVGAADAIGGYGGGWASALDGELNWNVFCCDAIPGGAGADGEASTMIGFSAGCPIPMINHVSSSTTTIWGGVENAGASDGGNGGSSVYGAGGLGSTSNGTAGANATGYGAGGGGSYGHSASGAGGKGGDGSGGLIIIEEWE